MLISYGLVRSPLRLTVRTPDFQSDNKSSTLLGGTNYNAAGFFSGVFAFFIVFDASYIFSIKRYNLRQYVKYHKTYVAFYLGDTLAHWCFRPGCVGQEVFNYVIYNAQHVR